LTEVGWRIMRNKGVHKLYASPNIINNITSKRKRWTSHVACMGDIRNAYDILVGIPSGERSLGRNRRRW